MPLLALVALFILVPIAELYVIFAVVGDAIGILPTLLLLVLDSILGSLLLRSQGRAVWRRFTQASGRGQVPHREVMDGALVIMGGALLLTPGFITDIVGLLLLIPPTRAVVRRVLARALARRVVVGVAGAAAGRRRSRPSVGGRDRDRPAGGAGRGYDVDGTASEVPGTSGEGPRPRLER